MENKKKVQLAGFPAELHAKLIEICKLEKRSLNKQLYIILEQYIKKYFKGVK